jgi:hypothetical protein
VNDYLQEAGFSGTDSKLLTGSMWVKFEGDAVGGQNIIRDSASRLNIYRHGSEHIEFSITDGGGSAALGFPTSTLDTNWHHVLFSFDMSDVNKRHVYIDDVDDTPAYVNYNDLTLRLAVANQAIGGNTAGGNLFNGNIADFWFDHGTYIDFSVEANRRKFIDNIGYPVNLGADGSLPTGNAPEIFLSGDHIYWHSNKGTGGGYTENGELTDASGPRLPSDNALVGYWPMDEQSGGTMIDYVSNSDFSYNGTGPCPSVDSQSGVVGTSVRMVDASCAATLSDPAGKFLPKTDFSVAGWYNFDRNTGITFFIRAYSGAPWRQWELQIDNSSRVLFIVGSSDLNAYFARWNGPIEPNTWYHIAGVKEGASLRIYINGVDSSDYQDAFAGGFLADNNFGLALGLGWGGGGDTDFKADEIRFYDRALTQAEILDLINDCSNPTGQEGAIIYSGDHNVMQYCNGREWIAIGKRFGAPSGCTNIGDLCSDGTVYAGLTPDGNVPMYTTPADAPSNMTWNNGTVNPPWTVTGFSSITDGDGNTAGLAALSDAGSPYIAAQYCYDLIVHGHDDWYLPADNEVLELYNNRNAGALNGTFDLTGSDPDGFYLSSSEASDSLAALRDFSTGLGASNFKSDAHPLRCVRK